jgi:hypothetical protein
MAKMRKTQITVAEHTKRKAAKKAAKARKRSKRAETKAKAKAEKATDRYQNGLAEIKRYVEAQRRRAKQAEAKIEKAKAARVSDQAQLIALRASMALEWLVLIRFARGSHQITVARPTEETDKQGYTIWLDRHGKIAHGKESRACRKVRADLPALRFREAEDLAANIRRKFSQNAPSRKVARRKKRIS